MRRAGIVVAQRGGEGGDRLGPPPGDVAVADIVRAVEGPLADVRGEPPEEVTLADLAAGRLPVGVGALTEQSGAWERR